MKQIKLNDYIVSEADYKAANWARIDSGNDTTWQRNDYTHNIEAIPLGDDMWWDGIEAEHVPAIDADGNACEIAISMDVCDDESSHIYINSTHECGHAEIVDDDGDTDDAYAYALAEIAGYAIGGQMELDYDAAVDEFVREHEGARYIMHNLRGFANEWVLWVCLDDAEAQEAMDATGDYTEYDVDGVRGWLKSAMQSGDDYKAEHGCDKCVCAKYWSDHE